MLIVCIFQGNQVGKDLLNIWQMVAVETQALCVQEQVCRAIDVGCTTKWITSTTY